MQNDEEKQTGSTFWQELLTTESGRDSVASEARGVLKRHRQGEPIDGDTWNKLALFATVDSLERIDEGELNAFKQPFRMDQLHEKMLNLGAHFGHAEDCIPAPTTPPQKRLAQGLALVVNGSLRRALRPADEA